MSLYDAIRSENQMLLDLVAELENLAEFQTEACGALLATLRTQVAAQAHAEEMVIYPMLVFSEQSLAHAEIAQSQKQELLRKIDQLSDTPISSERFRRRLTELHDVVRAHVFHQQNHLLRSLQESIVASETTRLGELFSEHRAARAKKSAAA